MIAARNPTAREILNQAGSKNTLATNDVIRLEVLYSVRNAAEHKQRGAWLASLKQLETGPSTGRRAIELQGRLAATGRHRIPVTDLLIAACAEQHAADLLHYNRHFDLIAEVSELRAHWIVPRAAGH